LRHSAYHRRTNRTEEDVEEFVTAMADRPRVQVVLGEAERTDGLLRFVLEGEGFDVIGLASDDQELARVLRGAQPAVIVVDGGISALAALEARRQCPGASLVVVWPEGVSGALAQDRVDPHLVISDLGPAVQEAAERAERVDALLRLPDARRHPSVPRPGRPAPPSRSDAPKPARTTRRGSRILVAAATWLLVLTALATIAVAVPKALDLSPAEHGRSPRSSPSAPITRPDGGTEPRQTRQPPERSTERTRCADDTGSAPAERCADGETTATGNASSSGSEGPTQGAGNGDPGAGPPGGGNGDTGSEAPGDTVIDDVLDQVDEVCALLPTGCP
jgi:hypothetical protein